jgi:hypothetical protein
MRVTERTEVQAEDTEQFNRLCELFLNSVNSVTKILEIMRLGNDARTPARC